MVRLLLLQAVIVPLSCNAVALYTHRKATIKEQPVPPLHHLIRSVSQQTPLLLDEVDPKTVADLKSFIDAHGGSASIVMMGDSTISSMNDYLLGVMSKTRLVHAANDRGQAVRFPPDMPAAVQNGDQWATDVGNGLKLQRTVIGRAKAAHSAIHSWNCTWSGGMETYLTTSGSLKGLVVHHWGFIPEWGNACWDTCYAQAIKELKPDAMLWNVGLHLLNYKFDQTTCEKRNIPGKRNCDDYSTMVTKGMTQLSEFVPTLVWKTTNYLCEPLQVKHFPLVASKLSMWNDMSQRAALETICTKTCPVYAGLKCGDWVMTSNNTQRLYSDSMAAVEKVKDDLQLGKHGKHDKHDKPVKHDKRIRTLDAFTATKSCCEAGCEGKTEDGEHYAGMDKDFIADLAALVAHGKHAKRE